MLPQRVKKQLLLLPMRVGTWGDRSHASTAHSPKRKPCALDPCPRARHMERSSRHGGVALTERCGVARGSGGITACWTVGRRRKGAAFARVGARLLRRRMCLVLCHVCCHVHTQHIRISVRDTALLWCVQCVQRVCSMAMRGRQSGEWSRLGSHFEEVVWPCLCNVLHVK